mgnify:CR=1 FL=1
MQAFTILKEYERLRGNLQVERWLLQEVSNHSFQESYYNFGRSCHHIGLKSFAVEYYNKALAVGDVDPKSDLKRVIAYNLVQIYKGSGSNALAKDIMDRYLVV